MKASNTPNIQRADKRDIPPVRQNVTNWEATWQELTLRLEKTSENEALYMEFDTASQANNCASALRSRMARDSRTDEITLERRKTADGEFRVYVYLTAGYWKKMAKRKEQAGARASSNGSD